MNAKHVVYRIPKDAFIKCDAPVTHLPPYIYDPQAWIDAGIEPPRVVDPSSTNQLLKELCNKNQ